MSKALSRSALWLALLVPSAALAQFVGEPAAQPGSIALRIVVEQRYREAEGIQLPIAEAARPALVDAGLAISSAQGPEVRYSVVIRAEGAAHLVGYSPGGSKYGGVSLYTSATVKGTLTLLDGAREIGTATFSGYAEPPRTVGVSKPSATNKPSDAPFGRALERSNLRLAAVEVLRRAWPVSSAVAGLRSGNAHELSRSRDSLRQLAKEPAVRDDLVRALIFALPDKSRDVRYGAAEGLAGVKDARSVEPLLARLKDPDPTVRAIVISALGATADARAIAGIIDALQDSQPSVRSRAIFVLASVGGERAIAPLIATLGDAEDSVARAARGELERMGPSAFADQLLAVLGDARPKARVQATLALGTVPQPRVTERVVVGLRDPDERVRAASAQALYRHGGPAAYAALRPLLADANADVRWSAILAVEREQDLAALEPLAAALRAGLKDALPQQREHAASTLGRLGVRDAVPALVEAAKDTEGRVRAAAATAFGEMGDARAVPVLIAALGDRDPSVQEKAASSLGAIGDAAAVPGLAAALADPQVTNRVVVIAALRAIGGAQAREALAAGLERSNDIETDAITNALAAIDAPAVRPLVARMLASPQARARRTALRMAGRLKDPEVVLPAIAALRDGDHDVRVLAARYLKVAADRRALQPLVEALRTAIKTDDSPGMKLGAIEALGALQDASAADILISVVEDAKENISVRTYALMALGELKSPAALRTVTRALDEPMLQIYAIDALGQIRAPSSAGRLAGLMRTAPVQYHPRVVVALANFDDRLAREATAAAASSPDVRTRREALGALSRQGDAAALALLAAALKDPEQPVRSAAVKALAGRKEPEARDALRTTLTDSSAEVRLQTLEALGVDHVAEASAILIPLAQQRSDAKSSRTATVLLRQLRGEDSFAALMAAVQSPDPQTRLEAVVGLSERRDPRCVERLTRLRLFDEHGDVRRAAARALEEIAAQRKV